MKLGIIIQARMGSSRLPGKVLRDIAGRPLLGHVIGRLAMLRHQAVVVVATSDRPADDQIEGWCASNDVRCFRGDELDVLDRYFACATLYGFEQIVRLTADNPFTDIEELDRLLTFHIDGSYDYSHAFGSLPVGVGSEVFTFSALEKSQREGNQPHHREHVNEYFTDRPDLFRIGVLSVPPEKVAPVLRLTVDTMQDWMRADTLAAHAGDRWLSTKEAIALCSSSA